MQENKDESVFGALCRQAQQLDAIIGLFLGGSRGKDRTTVYSDYDVYIIVNDGKETDIMTLLKSDGSPYHEFSKRNDIIVLSIDGLKAYPPWAGDGYEAYDFKYLKTIIDKTGKIQPILDEKARRHVKPEDINLKIDAYINFFYRSLKCMRDGYYIGARLEANTSIAILIDLLFALHSRPVPYGKYLEWELETHPLEKLPISGKELLDLIKKILDDADVKAQRSLFAILEKISRDNGFGEQIDSWGDEPLRFMRNIIFT